MRKMVLLLEGMYIFEPCLFLWKPFFFFPLPFSKTFQQNKKHQKSLNNTIYIYTYIIIFIRIPILPYVNATKVWYGVALVAVVMLYILGPRYCGDVITEEFEEPPKPLCLPTTLCQFPGDS